MGFFTVTPKSALNEAAPDVSIEQSIIVVHERAIKPQLVSKYTAALAGVHKPEYARDVRNTSLDLEHSSLLWATLMRGDGMDNLALHVHDTLAAHPSLDALRHAAADDTVTTNDLAKETALVMAVSLRDLAHLRDSLQLSIDNATYDRAAADFAHKYVDTLDDALNVSESGDTALYFCIARRM